MENEFSYLFGQYYFQWPDIGAKKITELVLLFHKNITKLVFSPNISQKCFKVLNKTQIN